MLMASQVVGDRQLCARLRPSNPEINASVGNLSFNISQVPEGTVPVVRILTGKCTLGKGSCVRIADRFLYIQSGIQDRLNMV